MDEYVERLYTALTDALRRSRPRPFEAPVTVAEIYQELVPYRVVRASLGFEMNADYEHAVLQLLAGAGGLTRLEPESAAAELREELSMPNPNVGLFRKFAGCDVWIAAPADPDADEEAFEPESVEDPDPWAEAASAGTSDSVRLGDGHELAASDGGRSSEEDRPVPSRDDRTANDASVPSSADRRDDRTADDASTPKSPGPGTNVEDAPAPKSAGNREGGHTLSAPTSPGGRDQSASPVQPGWTEHPGAARDREASAPHDAPAGFSAPDAVLRCEFCEGRLPTGRIVRFCPHCGADQMRRPCVACGQALEREWRYCVACGAPQPEPGAA